MKNQNLLNVKEDIQQKNKFFLVRIHVRIGCHLTAQQARCLSVNAVGVFPSLVCVCKAYISTDRLCQYDTHWMTRLGWASKEGTPSEFWRLIFSGVYGQLRLDWKCFVIYRWTERRSSLAYFLPYKIFENCMKRRCKNIFRKLGKIENILTYKIA